MVSGVSIPAYWLSTFIWDNFSFQPTVWFLIILLTIFPNCETLGSGGALGCTIGLLILYGSAISGFSYLLSFRFESSAGAQIGILFVVFVLGLILGIVGIVLRILPTTRVIYMSTIRYVFMVFPPYALAEGLHNLVLIKTWGFSELSGTATYSVTDWNIAGMALTFLGWETFVYLFLTIVYDYAINTPAVHALFCKQMLENQIEVLDQRIGEDIEDEDVQLENERVASGAANEESVILLKNLKKIYPGGKYAVKGVSLGIPNGECFGLLGINGAGNRIHIFLNNHSFTYLNNILPPRKVYNSCDVIGRVSSVDRRSIHRWPQSFFRSALLQTQNWVLSSVRCLV